MHGFATMMREGGAGALLAFLLGMLGSMVAIGGLITLVLSRRAAFYVGMASLVLAMVAGGAGSLGTSWGRRVTDLVIGSGGISKVQSERIRMEGYSEAAGAAKIGFGASLIPLVLGALVVLVSAGGKPKSPVQAQPNTYGAFAPFPPSQTRTTGRWVSALAVVTLAILSSGGAFAVGHAPLPKGNFPFDRNDGRAWQLAEARETYDTDHERGCNALDAALDSFWLTNDRRQWPRAFSRDPASVVPDWRIVATACAGSLWSDIKSRGTTSGASLALLESPLLVDDGLHAEILAYVSDASQRMPLGADDSVGFGTIGGLAPRAMVRDGQVGVRGRLPPEVIRRVVQRHKNRFRACFDIAQRKNPSLSGQVRTKFVIAQDGSVSSAINAGSDLPDASATNCIVHAFSELSFPAPEGGSVTVTYPLFLAPAPELKPPWGRAE